MQAVIVTKAKNEAFDEKCDSGRDFALFVWVAASNVWGDLTGRCCHGQGYISLPYLPT